MGQRVPDLMVCIPLRRDLGGGCSPGYFRRKSVHGKREAVSFLREFRDSMLYPKTFSEVMGQAMTPEWHCSEAMLQGETE